WMNVYVFIKKYCNFITCSPNYPKMKRNCLECGEKISGRSDKKFCSDYCRNAYNNRLNKDTRNLMRNVHNRLRKNYRILEKLNSKGKTTVPKGRLLKSGFNFTYFTSIYT